MATNKVEWISEEKALELLGFSNREALRKYIRNGRVNIAYTQVTQKSARFYNKVDVDRVLMENSTLVSA